MSEEIDRQSIIDEEHLKLLSLGYVISGGVAVMFSLFGLLYVFIGIIVGTAVAHAPAATGRPGEPPPAFVGWLFAGIGVAFFLVAIAMAIARFWAALSIRRRKSRILCMVVAGLNCLEFPYGTLLGVLTFVVLARDSVARTFASTRREAGG
jgi:hypothetical protein